MSNPLPQPSVTFLNRVYPPQSGATGQLLSDLARELAGAGWRVTVVTAQPPQGGPPSQWAEAVRLERVGGLPFSRAKHWQRALSYLSLYPALLWRAWRLPPADVVVTMTDPPLLVVLGPLLQALTGCRLLHWAQDLYPELAEELGVLKKNGLLARLLRIVSTWALRRSDRILAVGRCMEERLIARGLSPASIGVLPNWALRFEPDTHPPRPDQFREQHGLTGHLVVMYSGHLGLAHPFSGILDAAAILKDRVPEVRFVFVGEGPRLHWVREQTAGRRLTNVRFLPPQPRQHLMSALTAADVHLATLEENLLGLVVPSKVYGVFASGRPCVLLGPAQSEVARVIRQFQCGATLNPQDGEGLADCLTAWTHDRTQLTALGHRALQASRECEPAAATAHFRQILQRLVQQPAPPILTRLFCQPAKP